MVNETRKKSKKKQKMDFKDVPDGTAVLQGTLEEVIIELVKAKPLLYNIRNCLNRDSKAKQNAWNELGEILGMDACEVEKIWRVKLRDQFLRIHRKQTRTLSGQSAQTPIVWPYYSNMLWYLDFANIRNSIRTESPIPGTSKLDPRINLATWSTDSPTPSTESRSPPISGTVSPINQLTGMEDSPNFEPPASVEEQNDASTDIITESDVSQENEPTCPVDEPNKQGSFTLLKKKSSRTVPPPDTKRAKKNSDFTKEILFGMADVTSAVKSFAAAKQNSSSVIPAADPKTEAFKTLIGLEFDEVPENKKLACRIAVLEVISKFKEDRSP